MTEGLEEILNYLIDTDKYNEDYGYQYKRLSLHDASQLLNYITNLEYEKEMLDNEIFWLRNDLNIYKSRCKKAIEYIKECKELEFSELDVLNILNGSDENE